MTTANIINYILIRFRDHGLDLLKSTALAVGIFVVFLIIIKNVVNRVKQRIQENSLQEDIYSKKIANLAWSMLFVLLMIFNILAVFQVIGFDVALIMWAVSISIGFAMDTTIGNMIAGVMIMTNEKVKLGDFVEFMGSLNLMGTIEEINIRYTVIRSFDKRRTIIPNSMVAATPIKTLKSEILIRGNVKLRFPRHIDVNQVKSLLIQILNSIDGVLHKEYTNIVVTWFDTWGIIMQWFFFVNPQSKRNKVVIKKEFLNKALVEFKKYGIKIPYNHMTITVED
ncbi:MAG: MscS mechanosensitive ion channel [uncultured bacterium (gcode 4)]|uniref:MscS mechanosensitive ion channel n=1 Tax=uncultured bacterium (gcode 4) TaxID=1234023 RepID=K1X5U6_9BACT|nr:MAG: MscS mechanosensitive ion channel [uncultured bacterium (gcode 4)]